MKSNPDMTSSAFDHETHAVVVRKEMFGRIGTKEEGDVSFDF